MKKSLLATAMSLAFIYQPLVNAAPDTQKMYGAAAPFTIEKLPASRIKAQLEKLPPAVQQKALTWLHDFDFPQHDLDFLNVDDNGGVFYLDTFDPELISQTELEANPSLEGISPSDIFKLHSKPNASNVVYINFVGATVSGTAWNNSSGIASYQAKPFDTDGNTSNFSTAERQRIAEIWHRIAEDYAPFDIDVTTGAPVSFGPNVGHVLITSKTDATGTLMPHSSAGGVAYVGVWGGSSYTYYQPALVYYDNLGSGHPPFVAEAASHELGHNLNLSHDGTSTVGYYQGHGSGLISWGPIMGVGYYTNVTQWSKGEYTDASNTQDDLNIIATRLSYASDDHGDDVSNARQLLVDSNGYLAVSHPEIDPDNDRPDNKGIIETSVDKDVFYFDTAAGDITLQITPAWLSYTRAGSTYEGRGANLDIQARLFDDHGFELIVDPSDNTDVYISTSVTEGRYYLEVTGVGSANSPYTDYGSIGNYYIYGQVVPFVNDNTAPTPNPSLWSLAPTASSRTTIDMAAVTSTDDSGLVEYQFICTSGDAKCINSAWQTSDSYTANLLSPNTSYTYQVKARDNFGNETSASVLASATTDTNYFPVANDDVYSVNQNQTSTFDVLANDADSDNDILSIVSTGVAQNGTVSIVNNQISYTPDTNFSGDDSFTYIINDGYENSNAATVSVSVQAVNQAPTASVDTVEVLIGGSVIIDVLANDSDPEGDALSVISITDGSKGVVANNNNGTVTYDNTSGKRGGDSFSYTITDTAGNTAIGTVNVSIVRTLSSGGTDGGDGTTGGTGGKKCNPRKQSCP